MYIRFNTRSCWFHLNLLFSSSNFYTCIQMMFSGNDGAGIWLAPVYLPHDSIVCLLYWTVDVFACTIASSQWRLFNHWRWRWQSNSVDVQCVLIFSILVPQFWCDFVPDNRIFCQCFSFLHINKFGFVSSIRSLHRLKMMVQYYLLCKQFTHSCAHSCHPKQY